MRTTPRLLGTTVSLLASVASVGTIHASEFDAVTRDAETIILLELWLQRPRRDYWGDLRDRYAACDENRACSPIPVNERVNTDFLWQRSPFQLFGGGAGTVETAAIDYLLPYWMARHFGLPV